MKLLLLLTTLFILIDCQVLNAQSDSNLSFEDFCNNVGLDTSGLYYAAQHGHILEYGYGKLHKVGFFNGGVARISQGAFNDSDLNLYIGKNWDETDLSLTINTYDSSPADVLIDNDNIYYLGAASNTGYPQWSNMVFRRYDSDLNIIFEHEFVDDGYAWDPVVDAMDSKVILAYRNQFNYYVTSFDTISNSLSTLDLVLDDGNYGTISQPVSCVSGTNLITTAFYDNRIGQGGFFELSAKYFNIENKESKSHVIAISQGKHGINSTDIASNHQITAAVWDFEGEDIHKLVVAVFDSEGELLSTFDGNVNEINRDVCPKIFVTKDSRILIAYGDNSSPDGWGEYINENSKLVLFSSTGQLLWQSNFYDSSIVFSGGMILDGGRHGFDYNHIDDVIYYNYVSQNGVSLLQRLIGLKVEGDEVRIQGSLNAPSIISKLEGLSLYEGERAVFQANVIGEEIVVDINQIKPVAEYISESGIDSKINSFLQYEWYKNGLQIDGENSNRLVLDSITNDDQGQYYYKVSNHLGSVVSNVVALTVSTPVFPPVVVVQPVGIDSLIAGSSYTLSVNASGESLNYQWEKDGIAIEGATLATYTLSKVSESDAGAYSVSVSNSAGSVTSDLAQVKIQSLVTTNEESEVVEEEAVEETTKALEEGSSWVPVGWIYYTWPYAYSFSEARWHFFNELDTQWRVNLTSSVWATLDATSGWNYYAWPYSYSFDEGAWHWYNNDIQWVVDLLTGEWSTFGSSGN